MSLRLPHQSSPVRELFDVRDLAGLGDSANVRRLPTYRAAIVSGRAYLEGDTSARAVHLLTLRADGDLWLLRVTRKAARPVWKFGKVA